MGHVFISYSHDDSAYAIQLVHALQVAGFEVWFDEQIEYGDAWWPVIEQAIQECDAIIALMSPAGKKSRWVQCEIMLAVELHKPSFPVLLAGERWALYVTTQYADMRGGEMPDDDFLARLAQVASRVTPPTPDSAPDTPLEAITDALEALTARFIEDTIALHSQEGRAAEQMGDIGRCFVQIRADNTPTSDETPGFLALQSLRMMTQMSLHILAGEKYLIPVFAARAWVDIKKRHNFAYGRVMPSRRHPEPCCANWHTK
ncbi:MAG: toll/interleukin-1 receptor domain-containing protein [Anaerolineae bacterium]|nr:toll/interleukin-1 receptor domain-containing protein [Anaerolineae bacterium]